MAAICLQAGHEHIQSNCLANMRGSTGAPGEAGWNVTIRAAVAKLLRAHKFTVVEQDANLNCGPAHPRFDLTLAIHYQADTGHSGFGVFVADPSYDRDLSRSIVLGRALARVYAARTGLANYSSPRLGLNKATWENPNTLFYYAWYTQNGPLALIECGEGSAGAPDHVLLYTHADRIAAAIAEGVCNGFGVQFIDPALAAAQAAAAQAAAAAAKAKTDAEAAAAAKAAAEAAHAAAAAAAAQPPIPSGGSVSFNSEPVIISAIVLAVLNLGAAIAKGFGVQVTPEQIALANAVLLPVLGWFVRSKVAPIKA